MTNGRAVVTGVGTGVRRLAARPPGSWALIACGGRTADWLQQKLRDHDQVQISKSFAHGRPQTLVSGGAVLVRRGAAYNDRTGLRVRGENPETFACLSRSGRSVLLGVVDGRSSRSASLTSTG